MGVKVPELTLRDGMVIVGSLLILAVIVDAWRRIREQRRSRVRIKLASDIPPEDVVDERAQYRELPNGGHRVVTREQLLGQRSHSDTHDIAPESASISTASKVDDSVETAEGDGAKNAPQSTQPQDTFTTDTRTTDTRAKGDRVKGAETKNTHEPLPDSAPLAGVRANDEPANLDWLEDLPDPGDDDDVGELPRDVETEVIVLHVMSRDEHGFKGKDILEILLACDLRFGDMNFFHRHEHQAGRGPIQFSVANMLQPGVFDIDNMDATETRGLVFFVTLPGPENMGQAFDYMLETARAVARNLGGELLDESRSVLTQQAVEHSRQQIRELERRLQNTSA